MLQLQDLRVVGQEFDEQHDRILVICVPRWPASICPECGQLSEQIHDYPRQRAVHDAPIRGYPSQLVFDMRRFWCEPCQRAFTESLREVVPDCTYSYRLMAELANPRRKQDVATLAEVYGLGYKLVESILLKAAEQKLAARRQAPVTVTHLGVDEITNRKGQGDYRLVLTDLKRRQLLDVLPDRRKQSLIEWLQQPPPGIDLSELAWVATDLWSHYRAAVHTVYPAVEVVADRFHVMQNLQQVIHQVRRRLQREAPTDEARSQLKGLRYLLLKNEANLTERDQHRLEQLQAQQPKLYELWSLRQQLHEWYEAEHTLEKARTQLKAWIKQAKTLGWKPLNTFCQTLQQWEDEVVNFFPSAYHQRLCRGHE